MTKAEIERVSKFLEDKISPENTRIQKRSDNDGIVYNVLQASIEAERNQLRFSLPDSEAEVIITQGDHSSELRPVCECLEQAREFAANSQQKAVIDQYLTSFRTGDVEAFKESQRLWVKDLQPTVENAFGFVEPYRDPHGTRAEFEGIVAFVNIEETKVLTELVNSYAEYICSLPWTEGFTENHGKGPFEKELFEPPDFTSLQSMTYFIFPQLLIIDALDMG